MSETVLIALVVAMAVISFILSPRVKTTEGFFKGFDEFGQAPGLWTLTLSQVTTWIFARSLMNAAILGFYYGIAGTLAYAAYYLSFLTGGYIVDRVRFEHGYDSIQAFLFDRYGRVGTLSYNILVGVRLLSEVFANLLVIGIIFGVAGSTGYTLSIIAIAVLTLVYSMMGGLRASLRTDVFQTLLLIASLIVLVGVMSVESTFDVGAILASSPDFSAPGWILLAVALLQVWSYPMHDPVMMDRGFLADRVTTRKSFQYACAISVVAIILFGLLGIFAGLNKESGEAMVAALTRLLGEPAMIIFNVALIVSAVSTFDSTFSSSSKLVVDQMGVMDKTVRNGRIVMALFLLGGLFFLFLGQKDLFAAVAVSGTASMFLTPVIFFNIMWKRETALWAYVLSFFTALAGGALYMMEAGGHLSLITPLLGLEHKYAKLLMICLCVLGVGMTSFALGSFQRVKAGNA
ncbi:sodium:solute symporter family transporter [Terasakiella pusilla]|uniref:sodium:solute symporter family transporter n=1 Tax=Terasakiella pusilla TaxID=64973 RepID=UPI003AA8A9A8